MGQGQSINTFDYNHVNQLLKSAPQYKQDQWQSSSSGGKTQYWQTINQNLKAIIDPDYWPLTDATTGLTAGHHYAIIKVNKGNFPYDIENDQFANQSPDNTADEFLDKWKDLVKSAESNAAQIAEQQQRANTRASVTRTTVKTTREGTPMPNQQYGGGHSKNSRRDEQFSGGQLTDEDLTQIATMIQPLEDKIDQLQKQLNQLITSQNAEHRNLRSAIGKQ